MTPAQAIAALDRQLVAHGCNVTLSRPGGPLADFGCRGFLRNFKPDELVGSIQQGDRLAILSPTTLGPAGWLGIEEGDRVGAAGAWCRVQAVNPKELGGVVVRLELHLRGI